MVFKLLVNFIENVYGSIETTKQLPISSAAQWLINEIVGTSSRTNLIFFVEIKVNDWCPCYLPSLTTNLLKKPNESENKIVLLWESVQIATLKMYHGALILWYLVGITIDYQPLGLDGGWTGQEGLDLLVRVQEGWLQGQVPQFTTPEGNQHFVILKKIRIFFSKS